MLVATIVGSNASSTVYYAHTDHLGGASVVTNDTPEVVELVDYYPYGNTRINQQTTSFKNKRQYIGEFYDQDTGLNYFNARYYNGSRGQFNSQDPVFLAVGDAGKVRGLTGRNLQSFLSNPQELNSYSYALNNPITKSDPTGLAAYGLNLNLGLEGGFLIFGGFNFGVSVNYVNNSETGESWFAPTLSFGVTAGGSFGQHNGSINYPHSPSDAKSGILGVSGGPSVSGSWNPTANSPNDLRGASDNATINVPPVSISVQKDKNQNQTFTAGPAGKFIASASTYPTKTWAPSIKISAFKSAAKGVGNFFGSTWNKVTNFASNQTKKSKDEDKKK